MVNVGRGRRGFQKAQQKIFNFSSYRVYRSRGICFEDHFPHADKSGLSDHELEWLQCIRPSTLAFRSYGRILIAPYWPSWFTRQFGYSQARVGAPREFRRTGTLLDGWHSWCDFSTKNTSCSTKYPYASIDYEEGGSALVPLCKLASTSSSVSFCLCNKLLDSWMACQWANLVMCPRPNGKTRIRPQQCKLDLRKKGFQLARFQMMALLSRIF